MRLIFLLLGFLVITSSKPLNRQYLWPERLERFNNVLKAIDFQHGRIAGGIESDPLAHPYQVGIILSFENKTETSFCGGSLVKRNYVLTAAHCADNGKEETSMFTIVLGAYNIFDEVGTIRLQSTNVNIHPDFNSKSLLNDLALIKLPMEVVLTDSIQIISLPPYSTEENTFNSEIVTAIGWGKRDDGATELSGNLREVNMTVITNSVCNLRYNGEIQITQLCTSGASGKGSCNGDDGGPLLFMIDEKKTQIGLYSYGFALGCEAGWPPVYTRLTRYLDWISDTADIAILP